MVDELSAYWVDLLDGSYDCVDHIVLNVYNTLCDTVAGFWTWWWCLKKGEDDTLDNAHLMRIGQLLQLTGACLCQRRHPGRRVCTGEA